jgi:hypothetical protein
MTRIALLLGDGAERATLVLALQSAFGDKVRFIDELPKSRDELVIAVVAPNEVASSLDAGCADFVTLPCDVAEVERVVRSLGDADTCEEAVALLGEGGRDTLAELQGRVGSQVLVLRGEKGTGAVSFARYWAGLANAPVRVLGPTDLADPPAGAALVITGLEALDSDGQARVWARVKDLSSTTRVAVALLGDVGVSPGADGWLASAVQVPPMRDRIADVVRIVRAFERLLTARRGQPVVVPLRSISAMQSHRWPNQLPELRATIDSLCARDEAPASRGGSAEYRVPVQSTDVTLHLVGGGTKFGSLFWPSEFAFDASLELGEPFFPVNVGGTIHIVARVAVEVFGIPEQGESVAWEPDILAKRVRARLHMQSGRTHEGDFVYSADHARSRVADLLNGKERYFLFRVGSDLLHVSKAHLVWVEELR